MSDESQVDRGNPYTRDISTLLYVYIGLSEYYVGSGGMKHNILIGTQIPETLTLISSLIRVKQCV